jgi:NADPH-dependent F420 reductase
MAGHSGIAVIGGTGKLGGALAARWASAGLPVWIGSRRPDAAQTAAADLSGRFGNKVQSGLIGEAASAAATVVITVPAEVQVKTLREIAPHIAGKLVIDATVPLVPPRVMRVQLPPEGSAAQRARAVLGDAARLVSAFHNVAAHRLADTDATVECDVLVFGDNKADREEAIALTGQAGLRGLHGGALANAAAAEALTSILIFMNRQYQADGAGLLFTGLGAPLDCDGSA